MAYEDTIPFTNSDDITALLQKVAGGPGSGPQDTKKLYDQYESIFGPKKPSKPLEVTPPGFRLDEQGNYSREKTSMEGTTDAPLTGSVFTPPGGVSAADTIGAGSDNPLAGGDYNKTTADMQQLYKKRVQEEGALAAAESQQSKAYDQRLERMLHEQGATADDLKPWNAQLMAPPPTNLWEKFGSPGFVIGMLASSFTGMPMISALNAGAAAMNAINEGDDAAYHRAFDTWKVNTDLAIKRFDMEKEAFGEIEDLRKNNLEEWHARATALAARFNDERTLTMLNGGFNTELDQAREAQAKSFEQVAKTRDELEDMNIKRSIAMSRITGLDGKLTPEASKHFPKALADAKNFADEATSPNPKTIDGMAMRNLVLSDTYQSADSDTRNKLTIDLAQKLAAAKAKETLINQEVQQRWAAHDAANPGESQDDREAAHNQIASDVITSFKPVEVAKEKETERYHDIQERIASSKLSVSEAVATERARHNVETERTTRLTAAGKLINQDAANQERARHDEAMEAIYKARGEIVTKAKSDAHKVFDDVRAQAAKEHPDWDDAKLDLYTNQQIAQSKNRYGGGPETIKAIAKGIEDGSQPPTLQGLYGMSGPVREQLQNDRFDLSAAQLEWTRAQRQITALNGAQLTRYVGLARSVNSTIEEVRDLADQMKLGGVPAMNSLELKAYINAEGNSKNGRLATRYVTAVNTMKEEFANLAQGGYAPTEPVWKLANQQVNASYGIYQINDALDEIHRLINYRLHGIPGIQEIGAGAKNRYTGEKGELQPEIPASDDGWGELKVK